MHGILCKMVLLVICIMFAFDVQSQKAGSGRIHLSVANVIVEVDPSFGGRISSLKVDGHEILYLDTASGYWGSTFWPSPQSTWHWPPPAKLDKEPYSIEKVGKKIVLKSDIDSITHLTVNKTLMVSKKDTAIIIQYVMTNHDTVAHKYAPWEITRVPCKGLVFAPKKSCENDYLWFDLNQPSFEKSKVNSDGEGWQAYVNSDGYIFVKTYPNILPSETAPGEGEFELYRDTNLYIELENQGKYQDVEPGGSLVWEVKWYVRKLPANIKVDLGNMQLVEYVLSCIVLDSQAL